MDSKDFIDVVDEKDNVIGKDTKDNKFKKEFISRVSVIFILDDNKNLLIVKRSPNKKSFPNRYDISVCGNVDSGESYEEAAHRELKEELGIECKLEFLDKYLNETEEKGIILKHFSSIFLGKYGGEVKLNEELVELQRLSFEELDKKVSENPEIFTPGFVNGFVFIKEKLKKIIA
ncbi:NUDIX domain-containing protein [Candidatus Woesearchaeota archaeon]|nr:NUDIX domain-containing protein [Candidatus Woesearchaeota archaeon]